jgi:DNA topoisomerase-1
MEMITRKKSGASFSYYLGDKKIDDKKQQERLKKMAIPPAWKEVEIAKSPRSRIQATGRDAAGRKQVIYSADHQRKSEKMKFHRTLKFAEALPHLRRQLEKDLNRRTLSKEKVLATIIMLIDKAYFRVGSEVYARENQTYGITTMRTKHVHVNTTTVTFDFTGKSGKKHHKTIKDKTLARIIKQLDELPGYDIFRYVNEQGAAVPINANDVNEYIKQHMGDEFTAKDFRTWGGTMIAVSNLAIAERAGTTRGLKKSVSQAVKEVAKKLGNTPAIARSSYIDPTVFELFLNGDDIGRVYKTITAMRPKKYIKPEERAVIKLLGRR